MISNIKEYMVLREFIEKLYISGLYYLTFLVVPVKVFVRKFVNSMLDVCIVRLKS